MRERAIEDDGEEGRGRPGDEGSETDEEDRPKARVMVGSVT
jgi:hypothetical protein